MHVSARLLYHGRRPVVAIRKLVELAAHTTGCAALRGCAAASESEAAYAEIERVMIFGIGTDVVQLARVERIYEQYGEHFSRRLLLEPELALFTRAKRPARFLAMRFAAKEAVVKAMGTGFAHGMWIRDVGMMPNAWGQPQIIFSGRGDAMCAKLGIDGGHLTLTDEAGLIVAVAVLMRATSGGVG